MPLFYQHNINETTKAAIWHIAEPESFFLNEVSLQREITHPHKRLQHLAGRYLLRFLFPGFPHEMIEIASTRKPFLPNEAFHFSISHCGNYAAAIVSTAQRTGVDIEITSPKVARIRHKFLNPEELAGIEKIYPGSPPEDNAFLRSLTLLWSAKEAVFKWYGNGEVDFSEHIRIEIPGNFSLYKEGYMKGLFLKENPVELVLSFVNLDELSLVWVIT